MLIRGTVRGTRQGFAFLTPEQGGEDVFIAQANLSGAIDGDRVDLRVIRGSALDFRVEGAVVEIVERPHPVHTGDVMKIKRATFVRPDHPLLPSRVPLRAGNETVVQGSKILFAIENIGRHDRLVARFIERIGDADDPALDSLVIAHEHHLPGRFPEDVIDEALEIASREDEDDRPLRHDYRDDLVLTIDPRTAKDFDDAVSIRKGRQGYRLNIHIADASHFVREGGAIDQEAALRGTSVYFPGHVIPMLPEVLSVDLASLNPGVERKVLTVEIDLDPDAKVIGTQCREGLIRSSARLHYRQAERMLVEEEGDREVREAVRTMGELAERLRTRRFRQGGFDLSLPETEVTLDREGSPRTIRRKEILASHRIIEEFMILANRAVARFLVASGVPLLFRVHGEPDVGDLERFAEVALALVPGARASDVETIPALRRFLAGLGDDPIGRVVQFYFLRSMKKAVYSPIDIGHFGLGIDQYCHFTSPIRRYPDLFNHRILRQVLRQATPDSVALARLHGQAAGLALSSSRTEQRAEKAEREVIRLKTLRWAERRIGDTFSGRVVGFVSAGFFVELDKIPIEGFVPREDLAQWAEHRQERGAFVDRTRRFEVRLGDPVEVQIVRVDLRERKLDLGLIRRKGGRKRAGGPRSGTDPKSRPGRGNSPKKRRSSQVKLKRGRADRDNRIRRPGRTGRHQARKRGRR